MKHDSLTYRLAAWLLNHPRSVAGALLAVIVLCAVTVTRLVIESGVEPFYDRNLPEQKVLDAVNARFVPDDLLFIAYESQDVFSHASLSELRALGEALSKMSVQVDGQPFFAFGRITSLTTVKDVYGTEEGLESRPLVPTPLPGATELERLRTRAHHNPIIRENLLGPDGRKVALLTARLAAGLSDEQSAEVIAQTRRLLSTRPPGVNEYHLSGEPAVQADTASSMRADLLRFVPLTYLVVMVVLFVALRRVAGIALTMVNVTLAFLGGMACLVWVGGTLNNLSTMMPPLMMVLSVASVMHYLTELRVNVGAHGEKQGAIITMAELLVPALMCEVTTAVGFAALAVSNIPAMRHFGWAAALAVMLMLAQTFALLALASHFRPSAFWVAPRSEATLRRFDGAIERFLRFVKAYRWPLLVGNVLLFGVALVGISRIVVNENTLGRFGTNTPIRTDTEFIRARLGGSNVAIISLQTSEPDRFVRPAELRKLEALDAFLRREVGADHVTSIADYVRLLHRGISAEDDAALRIPDTSAQVSQLLLLNTDDTLREFLDDTRGWARVEARLPVHDTAELERRFAVLEQYLAREFPPAEGYAATVTGVSRLWTITAGNIIGSQTRSLGLSFLLIFGPIFLLFRSVRAGLFTIPSNLLPIALVLGLMGWLGIELNTSTTMIASVVLGIVVDDTIHFTQHLRARLEVHQDLDRALLETFHAKGLGMSWTALIIALGFMVLGLSHFEPTQNFGWLTGFAMVAGVISELLLVPSLLLVTRTRLGTAEPSAQPLPPAPTEAVETQSRRAG